jgi:hypothetical protein
VDEELRRRRRSGEARVRERVSGGRLCDTSVARPGHPLLGACSACSVHRTVPHRARARIMGWRGPALRERGERAISEKRGELSPHGVPWHGEVAEWRPPAFSDSRPVSSADPKARVCCLVGRWARVRGARGFGRPARKQLRPTSFPLTASRHHRTPYPFLEACRGRSCTLCQRGCRLRGRAPQHKGQFALFARAFDMECVPTNSRARAQHPRPTASVLCVARTDTRSSLTPLPSPPLPPTSPPRAAPLNRT